MEVFKNGGSHDTATSQDKISQRSSAASQSSSSTQERKARSRELQRLTSAIVDGEAIINGYHKKQSRIAETVQTSKSKVKELREVLTEIKSTTAIECDDKTLGVGQKLESICEKEENAIKQDMVVVSNLQTMITAGTEEVNALKTELESFFMKDTESSDKKQPGKVEKRKAEKKVNEMINKERSNRENQSKFKGAWAKGNASSVTNQTTAAKPLGTEANPDLESKEEEMTFGSDADETMNEKDSNSSENDDSKPSDQIASSSGLAAAAHKVESSANKQGKPVMSTTNPNREFKRRDMAIRNFGILALWFVEDAIKRLHVNDKDNKAREEFYVANLISGLNNCIYNIYVECTTLMQFHRDNVDIKAMMERIEKYYPNPGCERWGKSGNPCIGNK